MHHRALGAVLAVVVGCTSVEREPPGVERRHQPLSSLRNLGFRGAPATDSRFISSDPTSWARAGALVFFAATDPVHGRELWVTDGTTAGTRLTRDIAPGATAALGTNVPMAAVGGRVVFAANNSSQGNEPWASDGTPQGTQLLADTVPGVTNGLVGTTEFVVHQGLVYFPATTGIWRTDGTPAGTTRVATFTGSRLTSAGATLFLTRNGELWRLGGPDGGARVVDPCPACNDEPTELTDVDGTLFFSTAPSSGTDSSLDVWTSDGTTAGTRLVSSTWVNSAASLSVYSMRSFGGRAYWLNSSAVTPTGGLSLWSSDGTDAGTAMVRMLTPSGSTSQTFICPIAVADKLYFTAFDPMLGDELWSSDGTPAGTRVHVDLVPGAGSSRAQVWCQLAPLSPGLVWGATNGLNGDELWVTNGALGNAYRISQGAPLAPRELFSAGSTVFFQGSQSLITGREPWGTDGTDAGTRLLRDIGLSPGSSTVSVAAALDDVLVFHAGGVISRSNGVTTTAIGVGNPASMVRQGASVFIASSAGLARTDGTDAGLQTVWTGGLPAFLSPTRTRLFFTVANRLYVHPSADGGAEQVATLPSSPLRAEVLEERVILSLASGIWASNGLDGGTAQLSTEATNELRTSGSRVYFVNSTPGAGTELFASDGVDAGLFADVFPGMLSSSPVELTDVGGRLFFVATTTTGERELFVVEPSGLVRVAVNLGPGTTSSTPQRLTAWQGRLLFVADDGRGRELWITDGLDAGALPGVVIAPGSTPLFTNPAGPAAFAGSTEAGSELWETDGTPAGTRMAFDLNPGGQSSAPRLLGSTRTHLFFVANDGQGEALFSAQLNGVPTGGGAAGGGAAGGGAAGGSAAGGGAAGGGAAGGGAAGGGAAAGGAAAGGAAAGGAAAGGAAAGGGASNAGGSGGGGEPRASAGCGCSSVDPSMLVALVLVVLRRRRKH